MQARSWGKLYIELVSFDRQRLNANSIQFRWEMEQYAADNERLRRKVSELGTRMEYYKSKVIKYRGMYMKETGQDQSAPSSTTPKSPAHINSEHFASSVNCKPLPLLRKLKIRS